MTHAVYAGTFDPPTEGHLYVLRQAVTVFDRVTVLVAQNAAKTNQEVLPVEWRAGIFRVEEHKNVKATVLTQGRSVADWAWENEAKFVVRGVRSGLDLEQELNLAAVNNDLSDGELRTVLIPTAPSLAHVSSSMVRQLLALTPVPWQQVEMYAGYSTTHCIKNRLDRHGPFPFGQEFLNG